MKAVQIVGLVIVGILLAYNTLNALAIGLAVVMGQIDDPPFVVGRLLFVLLFELGLIAIFRSLLRRVRAP
jgi:hypothetical protein